MSKSVEKKIIVIILIILSVTGWTGVINKYVIENKNDQIAYNLTNGGE